MKNLLLIFSLFFFSQTLMAEVAQPDERALDEDLNFKLVDNEEKKRKIASDKENEENKEESDQERDVASDQETQDSKVQYWKY
jgi:hypothetical protein